MWQLHCWQRQQAMHGHHAAMAPRAAAPYWKDTLLTGRSWGSHAKQLLPAAATLGGLLKGCYQRRAAGGQHPMTASLRRRWRLFRARPLSLWCAAGGSLGCSCWLCGAQPPALWGTAGGSLGRSLRLCGTPLAALWGAAAVFLGRRWRLSGVLLASLWEAAAGSLERRWRLFGVLLAALWGAATGSVGHRWRLSGVLLASLWGAAAGSLGRRWRLSGCRHRVGGTGMHSPTKVLCAADHTLWRPCVDAGLAGCRRLTGCRAQGIYPTGLGGEKYALGKKTRPRRRNMVERGWKKHGRG